MSQNGARKITYVITPGVPEIHRRPMEEVLERRRLQVRRVDDFNITLDPLDIPILEGHPGQRSNVAWVASRTYGRIPEWARECPIVLFVYPTNPARLEISVIDTIKHIEAYICKRRFLTQVPGGNTGGRTSLFAEECLRQQQERIREAFDPEITGVTSSFPLQSSRSLRRAQYLLV